MVVEGIDVIEVLAEHGLGLGVLSRAQQAAG